ARLTRTQLGLTSGAAIPVQIFDGAIEDVPSPRFPAGSVVAIVRADPEGRLQPTAQSTLRAARLVSDCENVRATVLLLVPKAEESQRRALAGVLDWFSGPVVLLAVDVEPASPEILG